MNSSNADRLCQESLQYLHAGPDLPPYDRQQCDIGVVHLGLGAFHRAHQAVYFDHLLRQTPSNWAISGVSLRSPAVRDQMAPQDGLYTLVQLDGDDQRDRIIGSVREALYLADDRARVTKRLADRHTKLITLTVTEKAYCLTSLEGGLDTSHPGISHDLTYPESPNTVAGLLTLGFSMRRAQGVGDVTVLCCDNLPDNGIKLQRTILEFAQLRDPSLARWIEREVAFPSTMVDRIVPKTVEEDRQQLAVRLGVQDLAMVKAESFSQWVIEDRFSGPAPDFRSVGALLVDDVDAYEQIKLRLLLGSHSAIAYLGCLAGYRYVDQAMSSPIGSMAARMMTDEILPVTEAPQGFDLAAYIEDLLRRFRNSGLHHQCSQIAMDGSLKVPIRLLDTITRCLERGVACDRLMLGLAAWIRYASGVSEDGSRINIDDPVADTLTRIGAEAGTNVMALADRFLKLDSVFPARLSENQQFVDLLKAQLDRLVRLGAKEAAATTLDPTGSR